MFAGWAVIPVEGEEDLPWDYFVLQAARGGVRVPRWVLLAMLRAVADRLGISADAVEQADIDRAIAQLPGSPDAVLGPILERSGQKPPDPRKDALRLDEARVRGSFRDTVPVDDLLHDASWIVSANWGPAGFHACLDAIDDPDVWDARAAVAAMLYLMAIRS